jgi:hypothetical protein
MIVLSDSAENYNFLYDNAQLFAGTIYSAITVSYKLLNFKYLLYETGEARG